MNNSIVTISKQVINRIVFFFTALIVSVAGFAQETKAVDVNINAKSDSNFFANPIVWVVGGAIFILLLVALLRSGNRNNA